MKDNPQQRKRLWVSVYYKCCNLYQRVYFQHGASTARGRCPRCLREVNFELSQDGQDGRFFCAEQ